MTKPQYVGAPGTKLTTIRLSGQLGKLFGRTHRFWIRDPAGAVRALCVQIKGFEKYLLDPERKTRYRVFVGDHQVDPELELRIGSGGHDIHIAPVIQGAKSGLFQAVVGIALVAAAFAFPAAALGGLQLGGTTGLAFSVGTSLVLSGLASLISPQPNLDTGDGASTNNNTSLGAANPTVTNGTPLPLAFGRVCVAPIIVSAEVVAFDTAAPATS